MVVPLILGKVAKDFMSGGISFTDEKSGVLIAGFVAAFIAGLLACSWMITLVKSSKLYYFSIYCFLVGTIAIAYSYFYM
jgi:undecaprenyl-diphosphatase